MFIYSFPQNSVDIAVIRKFQRQSSLIQRDSVWWMHTIVPKMFPVAQKDFQDLWGIFTFFFHQNVNPPPLHFNYYITCCQKIELWPLDHSYIVTKYGCLVQECWTPLISALMGFNCTGSSVTITPCFRASRRIVTKVWLV